MVDVRRMVVALWLLAGPVPAMAGEDDGGVRSVTIGAQTWMAENLEVTTFRNGDAIREAQASVSWVAANESRTPAFSVYEDNPAYRKAWGLLYNYFAVADARGLCPPGWRIPDNRDWSELEDFLGRQDAAFKMKSRDGWINGGGGSDASGFTGVPGGFRLQDGNFRLGLRVAYWWSLSQDAQGRVTSVLLFDYDRKIFRIQYPEQLGQSVRCIGEPGPGSSRQPQGVAGEASEARRFSSPVAAPSA